MTEFSAGTARRDITPDYPIAMGGFGQRAQKESLGVHDPLYAKSLFIDNGQTRLLFICTDLICLPNNLAAGVTEELSAFGLRPEEICLCASHTHSGPELMEYFVHTEPVGRYRLSLCQKLVQVGLEAMHQPVSARIRLGIGRVDFLINRRTKGKPNLVDPRVFALLVEEAETKKPLAALFSAGVHPVTLGHDNFLISADFPGAAQRIVEARLGVKNALFFNTTEGNVIPNTRLPYNSLDTRGYTGGTFDDAERIGAKLAGEVVDILHDAPYAAHNRLFGRRSAPNVKPNRFDLDPQEAQRKLFEYQAHIAEYIGADFTNFSAVDLSPLSTLWARASEEVVRRDMSEAEMIQLMTAVCHYFILLEKLFNPDQQAEIALPVQVIGIEDMRFLALPGEVLVEVGLDWQQRNGSLANKAFVIGLANGFMGYLPHQSNFKEPDWEIKYETLMNALDPGAMDIALDEGLRILLEPNHK
jgi:neutral ceramidase